MLSCQLKISKHYYGTGESFLFKFKPNTEEGVLELKVLHAFNISLYIITTAYYRCTGGVEIMILLPKAILTALYWGVVKSK